MNLILLHPNWIIFFHSKDVGIVFLINKGLEFLRLLKHRRLINYRQRIHSLGRDQILIQKD